ncbi:putative integral membrane protein [Salsuginibacillus halophilus]|uniref:Putative integral membrane protein n=1 Tax=Salsuginibacillus halophilus TaxID=517424 RepID=A0A2P8HFW6_9BACI|nr:lipopolysaccharide assembly protein LapA domain-containing protein [Salsuginibacillus halophilus]PSL45111.1 putative integral membrane protein [Salsuginibacillus halophilus]
MRGQWILLVSLLAVLLVAVFAVINVDTVEVNYLLGTAEWPLILVIVGSVLMGGLAVGAAGMLKVYRLQQENRRLHSLLSSQDDQPSEEESYTRAGSRRSKRRSEADS